MNSKIMFPALLVLMLVVSACGTASPKAMSTVEPLIPNTGLAIDTPMVTPLVAASLYVHQDLTFGSFLVDFHNRTLYILTNDTPGVSTCYGTCATVWPPFLTNGSPVYGTSVTASMVGTITRTDGSVQVTYNGWPLYYFSKDQVIGDTLGQGFQAIWYLISPSGEKVSGAMPAVTPTDTPQATSASSVVVNIGQNTSLGSFLVNSNGLTLYSFKKDTQATSNAAAVSACTGACASTWSPLLTTGTPAAGTGVNASLLSTFTRSDGTVQVTYGGWPLYTYSLDKAVGATNGEGYKSLWYVISPDGMQSSGVMPAASSPNPSGQLPPATATPIILLPPPIATFIPSLPPFKY